MIKLLVLVLFLIIISPIITFIMLLFADLVCTIFGLSIEIVNKKIFKKGDTK